MSPMEGPMPTPDMVNEINKTGEPVLAEMDDRRIASIAFGYDSKPEEISAARDILTERGFDPTYVDNMNRRRDLDNPLSAAQSYEQMLKNKQNNSGEASSL